MNVLVIGSCLIDFFVKIEDDDRVKIDGQNVTLPLGAKFPLDIKAVSLGGNSANVAAAFKKLSLDTSLYTYLGHDPLSDHIREKMEEKGVEILVDEIDSKIGALSLIFDFPTDRIIFSHHNVASYNFDESKIKTRPDIIFLTSIGRQWEVAYQKVLDYAKNNSIPVAFSPGSQQMKDMDETFKRTLTEAKYLVCNLDEAKLIHKNLMGREIENPKELLVSLRSNNFEILSITDGANGAYAIDKDNSVYKISPPQTQGSEKTGAGDAYAAGFLGGILQGKDIETAMRWGAENASGEMNQVGAQTGQLDIHEIDEKSKNSNLTIERL